MWSLLSSCTSWKTITGRAHFVVDCCQLLFFFLLFCWSCGKEMEEWSVFRSLTFHHYVLSLHFFLPVSRRCIRIKLESWLWTPQPESDFNAVCKWNLSNYWKVVNLKFEKSRASKAQRKPYFLITFFIAQTDFLNFFGIRFPRVWNFCC